MYLGPNILALVAKTPNWPFWANLGAPKNAKMVDFKYHDHETRVRTEPLTSKWLTLGDHGLRKIRKNPVCRYIGV